MQPAQLNSYATRTLLGEGLLQAAQTTSSLKLPVRSEGPAYRPMSSLVMGLSPPHSVIIVGDDKQEWLTLLHLVATHRPDVMPIRSFPTMWEATTMIMLGTISKEKYGWKVPAKYHVLKYVAGKSTSLKMDT